MNATRSTFGGFLGAVLFATPLLSQSISVVTNDKKIPLLTTKAAIVQRVKDLQIKELRFGNVFETFGYQAVYSSDLNDTQPTLDLKKAKEKAGTLTAFLQVSGVRAFFDANKLYREPIRLDRDRILGAVQLQTSVPEKTKKMKALFFRKVGLDQPSFQPVMDSYKNKREEYFKALTRKMKPEQIQSMVKADKTFTDTISGYYYYTGFQFEGSEDRVKEPDENKELLPQYKARLEAVTHRIPLIEGEYLIELTNEDTQKTFDAEVSISSNQLISIDQWNPLP